MRSKIKFAALSLVAMSLCGSAMAQKKPNAPTTLGPIIVVDSAGKTAGRYMTLPWLVTYYEQAVAITVNGALTLAPIGQLLLQDGTYSRGFGWTPTLRQDIYYPGSFCTGAPIVAVNFANIGVRPSVVDFDGAHRILYLGADVEPTPQAYASFRRWDYYSAPGYGGFSGSCTQTASTVMGVPLETTVELDVAYPHPLMLK
jgi:hypothetical protein